MATLEEVKKSDEKIKIKKSFSYGPGAGGDFDNDKLLKQLHMML